MKNFQINLKRYLLLCLIALFSVSIICFAAQANEQTGTNKTIQPPAINVLCDNYSLENAPNAVPNVKYKVFDATATDVYGANVDVEVKVYIYYSSQTRSRIFVEENVFLPICSGIYTVEYRAEDRTGNFSILTYDINCVDKQAISVFLTNKTTTAIAGVKVKLADCYIENFIGDTSCSINVDCDGKNFEVDKDGYFIPTYAGDYTVTYTYSDYNETGEISYTINVQANSLPVIYDDINLQKYYIVGADYNLPLPTAYSYEYGYPIKITPTVEVVFENGLKYEIADASKFNLKQAGEFSIVYKATFNGKQTTLIKNDFISTDVGYEDAKSNGKVRVADYFDSPSYVKKETLRSGVKFTTATDETKIDFINKLLSVEFYLSFGFSELNNHFDRFDILLTDIENSEQQIMISLIKQSTSVCDLLINGNYVSKVNASFYNEETQTLHYNNKTQKISLSNIENIKISQTVNGDIFNGFSSEFIMFSMQLNSVKGDSSIYIYKINNLTLSTYGDSIVPHLYYELYSGGKKKLGEKITIQRIYLSDVLAPYCSAEYSIKSPDGNYVVDENGVVLSEENTDYTKNYTFEVKEYGIYIVSMKIVDAFGNDDLIAYGISITDSTPPIVNLINKETQTVNVGSSVSIRKATANDDISGELAVYAYLVSPTLYTQEYKMGQKVILNQKGIYHVYYYAYDEAGNAGFAEYTIIVK